jgi:hypothetical protein
VIDHTDGTSNGAYMLVDITNSSTTNNNKRARLVSPIVTPNGEQCVEFWYYTDADISSLSSRLNIYVRTTAQLANTTGYLISSQSVLRVGSILIGICRDNDKNKSIEHRIDNGVLLNNVFQMVYR